MNSSVDSLAPLSPDNPHQLSRLRSLAKSVIAAGQISAAKATELQAALVADGQVTADAMALLRTVTSEHLSNGPLEFE